MYLYLRSPGVTTKLSRYIIRSTYRPPLPIIHEGDHIGYSLGLDLFRIAMGAKRRAMDDHEYSTKRLLEDDGEGDGNPIGTEEGWEREDQVDCELLVAGGYLHAHRVVLAKRSPVLEDMIAQARPKNPLTKLIWLWIDIPLKNKLFR